MMDWKRLLVVGALVLGGASLVDSQTITNVFRNKVEIRSTAGDALVVRGGTRLVDVTGNPDVPNLFLDSGHTSGAGFLGAVYYQQNGANIGRIAAKEFVPDRYGISFSVFNLSGLVERMKLSGEGELTVSHQPGFLAYNSSTDLAQPQNAKIDFDTEVKDNANNFDADTFTAPVTGQYSLCVFAGLGGFSAANIEYGVDLVTSNRTYNWVIRAVSTIANGTAGGCVHADMDAGDTAHAATVTSGNTVNVQGASSPIVTYFSGRLLP